MFLKNGWYCAGWSGELSEAPIGRRMLNEPVLVFRSETGEPVALEGRCPHRFAPLHMGTIENDRIACPYHGLVFDRDGACVFNPHEGGVVPRTGVAAFQLAPNTALGWVLAFAVPIIVIALWAAFVSPKAPKQLPIVPLIAVELVVFAVAAVGFWMLGWTVFTFVFVILIIPVEILLIATKSYTHRP